MVMAVTSLWNNDGVIVFQIKFREKYSQWSGFLFGTSKDGNAHQSFIL